MKTSQAGIDLIKKFESCELTAYQDSVGRWTIGWGATIHRSGAKVKRGDHITQDEAEELLCWHLQLKEIGVTKLLHPYTVNQNQFDALVSFAFNAGIGALGSSTLLKKIRANPNDPSIRDEFARWDKGTVSGRMVRLKGLTRRRLAESALYFS
jgi:lysozyme